MANKQHFTDTLLLWHQTCNDRQLPWKSETDPYKIWLSEIILQQTRALQGLPYYERYISHYPTIKDLAAADDAVVYKLWQGLGYYNRCKNMLATARTVAEEYGGVFPNTYEGILQLKGIGAYTASAIASFAFKLPYAVVDGNVNRVLSRYFAIREAVDSTVGKKMLATLAQNMLNEQQPDQYNQAIMDFGATVCTPQKPLCASCMLQDRCQAYAEDAVQLLPIKTKKIVVLSRHFQYIMLRYEDKVYVQQRGQGDIWQNLYEPYLWETETTSSIEEVSSYLGLQGIKVSQIKEMGTSKQRLTHRWILTQFYEAYVKELPVFLQQGMWVPLSSINQYAFPKTVAEHIKKHYI